MYELQNLSALKCFIQDNVQPGEAYLCTLNGDFLSPSLLSSLDLGAAAVSAMNAIPVTHACLGNHEFDHSIEILGQRLGELDAEVVNVFAWPEGEEHVTKDSTRRALANAVPYPEASAPGGLEKSAGAFLDALPRSSIVDVGGVRIGLLGLCTTSTPLSSARKPKGVVFAECVPLAKAAAKALLPNVDAVVALTHQTLPEDTRLAEEVPELAAILGGHEHTPFAGRMGHGPTPRRGSRIAPLPRPLRLARRARVRQRGIRDALRQSRHGRRERRRRHRGRRRRARVIRPRRRATRTPHRRTGCDGGRRGARRRWLTPRARTTTSSAAGGCGRRAPQAAPEELGKDAEDDESCAFESENDACGSRRRTTSCPRSLT